MPPDRRVPLPPGNGAVYGTVLVDGFFGAAWEIKRDRGTAVLVIRPFEPLSAEDRTAVAEEGERLLAFAAAEADDYDVRFALTP